MAFQIKVVEQQPGYIKMEGDKYVVAFRADKKGRPEKYPAVESVCDRPPIEGRVEMPSSFYKQFYQFAAIAFWRQKKHKATNSLPLFPAQAAQTGR